jgi:hypothetical protein
LKRPEARKPEELKVQNIQKHEKEDSAVKPIKSNIKKHEAHSIRGIGGDVELGFQPVGEEEEETYDRPRGRGGRGRGGRGARGDRGGRGFHANTSDRGAPRGGRGGKRGQKFNPRDDDFPTL